MNIRSFMITLKSKLNAISTCFFILFAILVPSSSQFHQNEIKEVAQRGVASLTETGEKNSCPAALVKITLNNNTELELLPDVANQNIQAQHFMQYEQTSVRDLTNYISIQGPELETRINALGPDELWIDIGTGLALAPLEKARKMSETGIPRLKVLALNKQPFNDQLLEEIQKFIDDPKAHYTQLITSDKGVREASVEHIGNGEKFNLVLTYLSRALGLGRETLRDPDSVSPEKLKQWMATLKSKTLELREKGINLVSGELAENVLAQSELNGKLITDMFGAYYYSPDRVKILEIVYKNMKPGAGALFTVDELEKTEVLLNGKLVPLEDYLLERFPDLFKSYSHAIGFKTLLMVKPDTAATRLDLGLEFKGVRKPGLKRVACQYGMCGGPQFQMVPDNRVVPQSVYIPKD